MILHHNDIFYKLKHCFLGRISFNDIALIKKRLLFFEKTRNITFDFYSGNVIMLYYNINKSTTDINNKKWLLLKNTIDKTDFFIIGCNYDYYIQNGKQIQYFKYFRFYYKYNILELVSDYYNKIPIFYKLVKNMN